MGKQVLLIVLFVLHAAGVQGQQIVPSLTGTDFWVAFIPNVGFDTCSLLIASEESCTAHIECQNPLYSNTVTIQPNRITRVSLPSIVSYNRGFHVTTTSPAVVYASSFQTASHDITAVLPTSRLGCDYMVFDGANGLISGGRYVMIVAPYEGTQIQVENIAGYTVNSFTPQRGEEVLFSGSGRIHSTHPVAVFEGYECANIPSSFIACDHIYEQVYPTEYWGCRFMVVPTRGRSPYTLVSQRGNFIGDMVMVTSRDDSCVVSIGGGAVAMLNAGESYIFLVANHPPDTVSYHSVRSLNLDFYQSDALYIETSKPVSTCFYITGIMFGGTPGDPASVVVPPLEQGVSHTIAAAYNSDRTRNHYINLVAPTGDVPFVTLDGRNIAADFTPTPEGYSWACLTVDTGTHIIDADAGRLQATFYGLGDAESYAYIAGTAVRSNSYDVRADRHYLCPGEDTVTVTVRHDSTNYHTEWQLDGQPLGMDFDTVWLVFDSIGMHRVRVVITPQGDTVWEIISINPTYDVEVADSVCLGDTLYWNGQALCEEGTYTAYLSSRMGCDSIVTMNFSLRTTKYSSNVDTICPHDRFQWQGRVLTGPGLYTDTMAATDGCDSILSLQLVEFDAPYADIVLDTDCAHYSYSIISHGQGDTTGHTIFWQASPPDSELEGQPWDSLGLSPSTTTTYSFSIVGRCPFDTSFTLHPIRWPVAEMVVRPEVLSVDHPDIEAYDQSRNADYRYWWVDGQSAGSDPEVSYRANVLEDSLQLTLVAVNEVCADTLTRIVPIVHSVVWAPNVFTPGGPDNNLFAPVLNESVAEELYIYNRQGLLVAHIKGDNPLWDGTHDGTPCPQGAYVWVLFYRTSHNPSQLQKVVGTVLLLK